MLLLMKMFLKSKIHIEISICCIIWANQERICYLIKSLGAAVTIDKNRSVSMMMTIGQLSPIR